MNEVFTTIKSFVDSSANWFEVIGFGLSIFTAIKVFYFDKRVSDFHKKHLFQTRISEQIRKLKALSEKISSLLTDFENKKRDLKAQIKTAEEVAKSIRKKLLKKDLKPTQNLINKASKIGNFPDSFSSLNRLQRLFNKINNRKEFNEECVYEFYNDLTGLITSLEELKKDNNKSILL